MNGKSDFTSDDEIDPVLATREVLEANIRTMAAALKHLHAAMRIDHDVNGEPMVVLMQFGSADAEFTPAEIAKMLAAIITTFGEAKSDSRKRD